MSAFEMVKGVILDDCLYHDTWSRDKLMRLMFMNGRHYQLMVMVSMQYPMGIPPELSSNIDYLFIFRDNILSNRKRIWENYADFFSTFESFCSIMEQTAVNNDCLVIHLSSKSDKLEDKVFWYRAEKREKLYDHVE